MNKQQINSSILEEVNAGILVDITRCIQLSCGFITVIDLPGVGTCEDASQEAVDRVFVDTSSTFGTSCVGRTLPDGQKEYAVTLQANE